MRQFADEESPMKCPVCNTTLSKQENVYICSKKHLFDIAKEGYINLLNNNKTKLSGDNKMMLTSRKEFLEKNYYDKVSDWLVKYIEGNIVGTGMKSSLNVLDVGCGEGYHLSQLRGKLSRIPNRLRLYGIDISKEAIKMAAKRDSEIGWIVANANALPFQNKSMAYIISMFPSFINFMEMERLLKCNGSILIIKAGKNHLKELKEVVYPEIIDKEPPLFTDAIPTETLELKYTIHLDSNKDIVNLLTMTPHYWNIKNENREKINELETLDVTIDVRMMVFN